MYLIWWIIIPAWVIAGIGLILYGAWEVWGGLINTILGIAIVSMFGLSLLIGIFFVVGNIYDLFGNDSSHTTWKSIKSVFGIVLSSLWCVWMVRIIIWLMS